MSMKDQLVDAIKELFTNGSADDELYDDPEDEIEALHEKVESLYTIVAIMEYALRQLMERGQSILIDREDADIGDGPQMFLICDADDGEMHIELQEDDDTLPDVL